MVIRFFLQYKPFGSFNRVVLVRQDEGAFRFPGRSLFPYRLWVILSICTNWKNICNPVSRPASYMRQSKPAILKKSRLLQNNDLYIT
jgi:hypothetical protein